MREIDGGHQINNDGMLDVIIAGKSASALIDSGSDLEIISERLFAQLPIYSRGKFKPKVRKIRVANTGEALTLGEVPLTIQIGEGHRSQKFRFNFAVMKDAAYDIFLGKQFLRRTKAVVNYGSDKIKLCDIFEVRAASAFDIEPESEVICSGRLPDCVSDNTTGYCNGSPLLVAHNLHLVKSVSTVQGNLIPLRCMNVAQHVVHVKEGQVLATFYCTTNDEVDKNSTPFDFDTHMHSETPHVASMSSAESDAKQGATTCKEEIIADSVGENSGFTGKWPRGLTREQKDTLADILKENITAFVDPTTKELGLTNLIEATIELKPGAQPCHKYPYRMSPVEREAMQKILDEMESKGYIRETMKSAWASPVLLVKKPHTGQYRLVCDLRQVNAALMPLVLRVPVLEDILDNVGQ